MFSRRKHEYENMERVHRQNDNFFYSNTQRTCRVGCFIDGAVIDKVCEFIVGAGKFFIRKGQTLLKFPGATVLF